MTPGLRIKVMGATAAFVGVALAGMLMSSPRGRAGDRDDDDDKDPRIEQGFDIAPVHLNLEGKNRRLVGLGSYIVNAVADCNGCHNGGGPPNFNYAAGGNPYFNQAKKTDPTTYLAGGQNFGPVGTPSGPSMYPGPNIITRNLTPDKTGRPEGGHTLSEFKQMMRTGIDFDHLHPTCTASQLQQIEAGTTPLPICIPTTPDNPVDGDLLQIMPWPVFQDMTNHELDAIYEYLRAIPCLEGPTDPNDPLHNDCGVGHQGDPSDARRRAKP